MRPDGLWHPHLIAVLTAIGHTEMVVIADAGLPVPREVERIDLLWRRGEPGFLAVLHCVLAEATFELVTYASELSAPATLTGLRAAIGPLPARTVPHDDLKRLAAGARVVVRTGEATPYANVVLHAGVPF